MQRSGCLTLGLMVVALATGLFWLQPAPLRPLPFPLVNLNSSWPGQPNYWRDDLRQLGATAVPTLTAELNRRYWGETAWVTWVRAHLPPAVAKFVPDTGGAQRRRQSVLWALGEIGVAAQGAIPELIRHRDRTPDLSERSAAVIALAKIQPNDPAARSNLVALLMSSQQTERFYAAQEFGALPVRTAGELAPLVSALGDTDGEVRANAAFSLAQFGPLAFEAVPVLRALLTNDYRHVPICAAYALVAISPQQTEEVLNTVTNILGRRGDLSEFVAPGFFRIAGTSAVSALPFLEARAAVNEFDWATVAVCQVSPAPSPEAIDRLARHPSLDLPELALLGRLGPSASNAVRRLRKSERTLDSPTLRAAVQAALARITNSVLANNP